MGDPGGGVLAGGDVMGGPMGLFLVQVSTHRSHRNWWLIHPRPDVIGYVLHCGDGPRCHYIDQHVAVL